MMNIKHLTVVISLCLALPVKAQSGDPQVKPTKVNADSTVISNYQDTADKDEEYGCILFNAIYPEFPGGTDSLLTFLARNIHYPEKAVKARIEGRCIVGFIIEKDGSVVDPKVVISLSPECDEEALRVVKMMPKWKPGIQYDEPIGVNYAIPIEFKLPQEETKQTK